MNRNALRTAVSAFVLIGLFLAYSWFVRDPEIEPVDEHPIANISAPSAESRRNAIKLGPDGQIEISGGEGADYTDYDDRTGLPVRRVKWKRMRPVAGAQKEFHITAPRFSQRLPGGGTATIIADEGVIIADRVNKTQGAWKHGSLSGNVRIVIDRRPFDEEPLEGDEASDSVVTIALEDLFFDLELGKLKTDGPLAVVGPDFEIEGVGLNLTWNQAANRVDELRIGRGKRMVLYREIGLLGFGGGESEAGESTEPETKPAATPPSAPGRLTSYLCTLEGAVSAVRYNKQNQAVAGLSAGGLALLFDIGRGGDLFGGDSQDEPTSQPTSQPIESPVDGVRPRLELIWSGGLALVPADPPAKPMRWGRKRGEKPPPPKARRRLEAFGPEVILTQGGASIVCGGLEYFDESQQIWLHRGGHDNVRIQLDEDSFATAAAIYIDRTRDIIKLVGDIHLESMRKPSAAGGSQAAAARPAEASSMTIECSQAAELHLYPKRGGDSAALSDELSSVSSELRSATFFGDVRVRMNDRNLSAHRLDLDFRKLAADEPFDALIESAVATGGVVFTGKGERVESGRLVLDFGVAAGGRPYVSRIDAYGKVEMTRGDSWLRGERVVAQLDSPATADAAARSNEFAVRTIDVYGNAELRRPEDNIGARGDQIAVWIAGENEFERAEITGTSQRPAIVHFSPYTVRGAKIDINGPELSLHVDGWSRLTFVTQRGLQGARGRPSKVAVTSEKALHVDGLNNTVLIEGDVLAVRGNEQLSADAVTLFLENVEPPVDTRPATFGLAEWLSTARAGLFEVAAAPSAAADKNDLSIGIFGVTRAQLGRKEPVRLKAVNALVQMEERDPAFERPLVHRSLSAPLIEVDIASQTTYTTGLTDPLVQDFRVTPAAGSALAAPASSGQFIPSDLVSGGPMQTVIRCEDGLTYALAGDDPSGRDSVVMRGGVQMLHLSGKEILDFETMPRLAQLDQETLQRLKDRHTTLACERLECQFGRDERASPTTGESDPMGARLMWLLGSGTVYLKDRQGDATTEVNADRISFDREAALISIFGTESVDARVYRSNKAKNKADTPVVGREIHLNLRDNTIRGKDLRGQITP